MRGGCRRSGGAPAGRRWGGTQGLAGATHGPQASRLLRLQQEGSHQESMSQPRVQQKVR